MRIALACFAAPADAAEQVRRLLHSLEALEDSADLIVFGSHFLQGDPVPGLFGGPAAEVIRQAALLHHTGISFGCCEQTAGGPQAVQLVFSPEGKLVCRAEQGSAGYFVLAGKTLRLQAGDGNIQAAEETADAVLWPVDCACNPAAWNAVTKFDYVSRAARLGRQVLLVNTGGGALHVQDGRIRLELPGGEQGFLFANV